MKKTVFSLLTEHKYSELRLFLEQQDETELALLMSELPKNALTVVFRLLSKELAADTFVIMDIDTQETLIDAFSDSELQEVFDNLFIADAVDIIEEMPAAVVKRSFKNTSPEKRAVINEILKYPENSAGSIMTVEYVALRPDMTIKQAFTKIRRVGVDKETIYTCYVTDDKKFLLGVVTAKKLMLSEPDDTIENIMERNVIFCKTTDDRTTVADTIEKYGFIALPVVDFENRLVGIITFDDAMDVIKEKTSEDIMKMAAVSPSDSSYFKTSVLSHSKNRLVWLIVLMISATFTGLIITEYESTMTALLVSFIPLLMDTAGNSGTQVSAIVIRSLATGEMKLKDFRRVLFKEFRIALIVGVALAVANAIRIWLLNIIFYHSPSGLVNEMFIVGITLVGAVVTAKLLGCCLPMLSKRLKLDPALFASPLMTTLVDTVTVLLYFTIASSVM